MLYNTHVTILTKQKDEETWHDQQEDKGKDQDNDKDKYKDKRSDRRVLLHR